MPSVAPHGASVGGRSLTTQFQSRAARSLLALTAVSFAALLLISMAPGAQASMLRSYYGLTVLLNDSDSPAIRLTLQLDPLIGDGSWTYMAESMTANVSLGPQLTWTAGGAAGGSEWRSAANVTTTEYFNFTAYITTDVQRNMTSNPSETVFATFTAKVVYTDNQGDFPWTIVKTVSFVLNYVPPPPSPVVALLPAAVLGVGGAGAIGAGAYVLRRGKLDELYLMHDSGMLIRHWSRTRGTSHDSDIMSGMLIVLQEFVRDTWKSHQNEDAPLQQLRFGPQRVILARGTHSVLAAVVRGRYLNGLPTRLQQTVVEFESSNASVLANWNGNVDQFSQVDVIERRFLGGGNRSAV